MTATMTCCPAVPAGSCYRHTPAHPTARCTWHCHSSRRCCHCCQCWAIPMAPAGLAAPQLPTFFWGLVTPQPHIREGSSAAANNSRPSIATAAAGACLYAPRRPSGSKARSWLHPQQPSMTTRCCHSWNRCCCCKTLSALSRVQKPPKASSLQSA